MEQKPIPIILIVLDTLRHDYSRELFEVLSKYDFIGYDNVIAPAPWTVPSHASIFTGLYPMLHGIHETRTKKTPIRFKDELPTIAKDLSQLGYYSTFISANEYIQPSLGFGKDFHETYNLLEEFFKYNQRFLRILYQIYKKWPKEKGITSGLARINKLLQDYPSKNLFIFANFMEVHEPYLGFNPFRFFFSQEVQPILQNLELLNVDPRINKEWRKKYSEQIKYIKNKITGFLELLETNGILQNSLVIITSDHGQLLGEHNKRGHGIFLYDELIRVPLFIKYPEFKKINQSGRNNRDQYISLINLRKFIINVIKNDEVDDSLLYSPVVYSESWGIPHDLTKFVDQYRKQYGIEPEKMLEKIMEYDKHKIAIYYKSFKGIFNVTDWKFEKIISYDPNMEITEENRKCMKKAVVTFLKTATAMKASKIILNQNSSLNVTLGSDNKGRGYKNANKV